ncbi:MAG: hypothetical protein IPM12_00135 [Flavobacteriales bacterium]|nr:hypothetical protein [Flavobacteriales bacterium]
MFTLVTVPDEKAAFMLELLRSLRFVKRIELLDENVPNKGVSGPKSDVLRKSTAKRASKKRPNRGAK